MVDLIPVGSPLLAEDLAEWEDAITESETALDAWIAWTPTLTNLTIGNGVVTARYRAIGKTVHYRLDILFGTTTVMGTSPRFTLPVAPTSPASVPVGDIDLTDTTTANRRGIARRTTGSTVEIIGYGTTGVAVSVTATVPHTWANTDTIGIVGMYESV